MESRKAFNENLTRGRGFTSSPADAHQARGAGKKQQRRRRYRHRRDRYRIDPALRPDGKARDDRGIITLPQRQLILCARVSTQGTAPVEAVVDREIQVVEIEGIEQPYVGDTERDVAGGGTETEVVDIDERQARYLAGMGVDLETGERTDVITAEGRAIQGVGRCRGCEQEDGQGKRLLYISGPHGQLPPNLRPPFVAAVRYT